MRETKKRMIETNNSYFLTITICNYKKICKFICKLTNNGMYLRNNYGVSSGKISINRALTIRRIRNMYFIIRKNFSIVIHNWPNLWTANIF